MLWWNQLECLTKTGSDLLTDLSVLNDILFVDCSFWRWVNLSGDLGSALTSKLHILDVDFVDLVLHSLNLAINCLLLSSHDLCFTLNLVNLVRNSSLGLFQCISHLLIDQSLGALQCFDLVLNSRSLVFDWLVDLIVGLFDWLHCVELFDECLLLHLYSQVDERFLELRI